MVGMEKLNTAPILNTIQVAAEVNAALRSLPGENVAVLVTKTVDPDNPEAPHYDVFGCKGGVVDGQLVES
jgi:hypothetical protein